MTNKVPGLAPKSRQNAYDVIDGERDYQEANHPNSPSGTVIDFANLLIEYTDKLAVDATNPAPAAGKGPLKRFREIAAIAIHAMEVHGSQPREDHVPASAGITGTVNLVGKADSLAKPTVIAPSPAAVRPVTPVAHPVHPAAQPEHKDGVTQHPNAEKK